MLAQWDDHEVTNNWWPGEPLTAPSTAQEIHREECAAARGARPAAPSTNTCRCARRRPKPGRVYRKISYGPLLDVFMLDMRSYRGPNGEGTAGELRARRVFPRAGADRLAQARADGLARDLEGDRRRHAARADRVYDADRKWGVEAVAQGDGPPRSAASSRSPTCSSFIKRAGIRNTRVAHRRRALHRRALLRSEQGGVPGLRAVLGIRVGPDPRRHVRAERSSTTRSGRSCVYVKAPTQEQGAESAAERRPAVLRPRRDRRRHRGDDRDAEGRRTTARCGRPSSSRKWDDGFYEPE